MYDVRDNFEQVFWSSNVNIFACMHVFSSHGFMLIYQMDVKPKRTVSSKPWKTWKSWTTQIFFPSLFPEVKTADRKSEIFRSENVIYFA